MNHSPEQLRAIDAPDARLVILAGAGSGKTEVSAARCRRLIAEGSAPHRIIAITFTVKAGKNLAERIGQRLYHAGTIHGLCLKEAHRWPSWGGKTPKILDDLEARAWADAIALDLRLHKKVSCKAVFEALATGLPLELSGDTGTVAKAFRRKCLAAGVTTMDLLLHEGVKYLASHLPFKPDALFWDEFQDSGPADLAILDAFDRHAPFGSITIVGDHAQSIFGFRGARVQNIRDVGNRPNWAMLSLRDNYRSVPAIVSYANHFGHLIMRAKRDDLPTPPIQPVACANETQELGSLRQLVTDCRASGQSLAILTRHNALAERLTAALLDCLPAKTSRDYPPDMMGAAIATLERMPRDPEGETVNWLENGPEMPYLRAFWQGNVLDTITALREAMDAQADEKRGLYGNITIGTVHSVKGLEFDVVAIAGAEGQLWPGNKKGPAHEEERRLWYVAVTRAREVLVITHCAERRSLYGDTLETHTPAPYLALL